MANLRPAEEWTLAARAATAASTGLAWVLLWYGLDSIGAPAWVYWSAASLLVGPVLAFLARDWIDFAGWVVLSVATSLIVGFLLLPVEVPWRYVASALRAWLPVLILATLLLALRRRFVPTTN